ncbi:MAG: XdhC family protein [Lachnospiraceae bacterium]|nr:XdhC family protein [Lachnospiraceae bacterium]
MSEVIDVFEALKDAMERGEDAVLCTVISASGSVPRRSGSRMLALSGSRYAGTVGGGYGEALTQERSQDMLREGRNFDVQEIELGMGKPGSIGFCGGHCRVILQLYRPADGIGAPLAEQVLSSVQDNRRAWLITEIRSDGTRAGVYDETTGFVGDPVCDPEALGGLLGGLALSSGEDPMLYAEPLATGGNVYIFGGGHVSREVVSLLAHTDFSVIVYENRPGFLTPERFPDAAELILGEYEDIRSKTKITDRDICLVMTRGDGDYAALKEVLQTEAFHVGCIGSRKKLAVIRSMLLNEGFTKEDIGRIHNPIGLEIGSETPAEIAVSVAAELIQVRAKKREETN